MSTLDSFERVEPAFEGEDQCICLCTNNSFVSCMAVMLQSVIETSSAQHTYDILILHKDVNALNQYTITQMAGKKANISIRFVDIGSFVEGKKFYTENAKRLSDETYYRILLPWVLSEAYRLCLYVDGDMICRKDIYEIFENDPGDRLVAGVRDYWGTCNCYIPGDDRRAYRESIGLSRIDEYIIGATLILNLPLFREKFDLTSVLELSTGREWLQHDQDVINVLARDSICLLSPKWGMVTDYGNNHFLPKYLLEELDSVAEEDVAIVHFAGRRKPWQWYYIEFHLEFWKIAERTPYFYELFSKIGSDEYQGYVAYALSDGKPQHQIVDGRYTTFFHNCPLRCPNLGPARLEMLKIKDQRLYLEGTAILFWGGIESEARVFVCVNGRPFPVQASYPDNGHRKQPEAVTYRAQTFSFEHPLDASVSRYEIRILTVLDGMPLEKTSLEYGKYFPLDDKYQHCYYAANGWKAETDGESLLLTPCSARALRRSERSFERELWATKQAFKRKATLARCLALLLKKWIRRPIWLVTDRLSYANDNGEAFFRYLCREKADEINAYFVINRNTDDGLRLKTYGKVVQPYSYQHKLLTLLSDCIVSSQTDEVFRNPFRRASKQYKDILCDKRFVFLQHGIMSNDLSGWLCKKRQNFSGFVTSTEREYQSVLNGAYHYTPEVVWLTGLPRFDLLENHSQKIVTVMPTWRRYLTSRQDHRTGRWVLKKGFSQSAYVRFYRSLMQHPLLNERARELGYELQFRVHSNFLGQEEAFDFAKTVKFAGEAVSYRQIYSESSLIVTDYSSSIYDFIYLYKPIIYTQFDADNFFAGAHMYEKGDFDYEKDGFGEVEYDLESTVSRIIEYMENGCELKPEYRRRIDKAFAFHDQNNCQRVYEKIIGMPD